MKLLSTLIILGTVAGHAAGVDSSRYVSLKQEMRQAIAQHPSSPTGGGGQFLNLLAGELGVNTLSPTTAYLVLGVLCAGCLALSAWWFTHFEYVPKNELIH